ncbi:MAG: DUF484 family protein [Pseudomonadota bacterium]
MRRKKKISNQQYKKLIKQAWDNEFILRRFQNLELQLMQCESLAELIHVLLKDYKEQLDLETVTLSLYDPDSEIRNLLKWLDADNELNFLHLSFAFDPPEHLALFADKDLPVLGLYDPDLHGQLFPNVTQPIKSVALLLLKRDSRIIGSLNLADSKSNRFKSNSGTDFLQRLSAVISVCFSMTILRENLRNIGLKDALTGINNRRFFDQRLPEEISRSRRYRNPLTCLFIDVDHFKQFNDKYGHASGDQILKQVAHSIRQELRLTDVVGRYGGEEFAALLVETDEEKAFEVAERIRKHIQDLRIEFSGCSTNVTVSIGIAGIQHLADDKRTLAEIGNMLVETADQALYQAKQSGRNRVIKTGS